MIEKCSFCGEMSEVTGKEEAVKQLLNNFFGNPKVMCADCAKKNK